MAEAVTPDLRYVTADGGGRRWRRMLLAHLMRLGPLSRRNRFLVPMPDQGLRRYTDGARPAVVIFAYVRGKVRGCAEIHLTEVGRTRSAEIALSVEDSHQNRGIGRALLRAALRQCRLQHLGKVWVVYLPGNSSLHHVTEEVGFVPRHAADPTLREAEYRYVPPILWLWRAVRRGAVRAALALTEGLWTLLRGGCKARG